MSNEKSGEVTIINGQDFSVLATVPIGKRPRGIHVSPDGKTVYVAVSGTPMEGPPQLDAHGNPIFEKKKGADDDDDANADKSADGIAAIDVASRQVTGKLNGGSDPEEFSLSRDGKQIYISNEDTKSASVIGVVSGKVEHIIAVGAEPEGVTTRPDGKQFFVTCEAGGDVYEIDAATFKAVGHFKVNGRPRSVAFLSNGRTAFVPSESAGELNVVDVASAGVTKTITLPTGSRPMKAWVSADDSAVYLTNGRAGTVSVLDAHSAVRCCRPSKWARGRGASASHRTARTYSPPTARPTTSPSSMWRSTKKSLCGSRSRHGPLGHRDRTLSLGGDFEHLLRGDAAGKAVLEGARAHDSGARELNRRCVERIGRSGNAAVQGIAYFGARLVFRQPDGHGS